MRLVLAALAVVALAGCGSEADTEPTDEGPREITNDDSKVYDFAGWTTETDPLTGYEYRCLTAWRRDMGPVAGMSMFCTPLIKQ